MSIIEKAIKTARSKPNDESSRDQLEPESSIEAGDDCVSHGSSSEKPLPTEDMVCYSTGKSGADVLEPRLTALSPTQDAHIKKRSTKSTLHLDFAKLQTQGFLSPASPRSRIAEEYRTIKRPLLRNISGKGAKGIEHANLIMVTSALQGDGKTFSSINLAISIAMEQDSTVLFVDADVVRATAGKTLGVEPGALGLIDLLSDQSRLDPADAILRTNIDNLRVLPAGNASDNSTELLASQTMHDFMIELSNRYPDRVIVFDSPPLLLTTEASVLASFMGQIVFVASADITPQHAVEEALEHIGEDKVAGVLLNRASRRRSKLLGIGSYGYGYGYGYSYGYGESRDTKSPVSDAEEAESRS